MCVVYIGTNKKFFYGHHDSILRSADRSVTKLLDMLSGGTAVMVSYGQ